MKGIKYQQMGIAQYAGNPYLCIVSHIEIT